MEASKVTISPNKLRFEKMSPQRRFELRKRNVLDLIRNTPAGQRLKLTDFRAVTQIVGDSTQDNMIRSMLSKGLIGRVELDKPKTYSYFVNEGTITKPKREPAKEVKPLDIQPPFQTLGDYAKQYAWEANSDSLREFVRWMDGKELDLRRMLSGGGSS